MSISGHEAREELYNEVYSRVQYFAMKHPDIIWQQEQVHTLNGNNPVKSSTFVDVENRMELNRFESIFDSPPKMIFHLLTMNDGEPADKVDSNQKEISLVEQYQPSYKCEDRNYSVIYVANMIFNFPSAPRDFCLFRISEEDDETGTYSVLFRSVEHPNVPERDGYVRSKMLPSGFLIKQHPENPMKSIVIYIGEYQMFISDSCVGYLCDPATDSSLYLNSSLRYYDLLQSYNSQKNSSNHYLAKIVEKSLKEISDVFMSTTMIKDRRSWKKVLHKKNCIVWRKELYNKTVMSHTGVFEVDLPPQRVSLYIKAGEQMDPLGLHLIPIEIIDDNHKIFRMEWTSLTNNKLCDAIILQTSRVSSSGLHVILTRSVEHPKAPVRHDVLRTEVMPTGHFIHPINNGKSSLVSYVVQMEVSSYLRAVKGLAAKELEKIFTFRTMHIRINLKKAAEESKLKELRKSLDSMEGEHKLFSGNTGGSGLGSEIGSGSVSPVFESQFRNEDEIAQDKFDIVADMYTKFSQGMDEDHVRKMEEDLHKENTQPPEHMRKRRNSDIGFSFDSNSNPNSNSNNQSPSSSLPNSPFPSSPVPSPMEEDTSSSTFPSTINANIGSYSNASDSISKIAVMQFDDYTVKKLTIDYTFSINDQSDFERLPDEIILNVMNFLSLPDLSSLSRVNRRFRFVSDDEFTWKSLYTSLYEKNTSVSAATPSNPYYYLESKEIINWKNKLKKKTLTNRNWREGKFKNQLLSPQHQHQKSIKCIQYDEKSNLLVSGSSDKIVKIWNLNTNECVSTIGGGQSGVLALSLDLDEENTPSHIRGSITCGYKNGAIKKWDISSGHCLWSKQFNFPADGFYFLKDRFVSYYEKKIDIWNLDVGLKEVSLVDHTKKISCVKDYNNTVLASSSADRTVKTWDIASGKLIRTYVGHTAAVNCVDISENWVVSGGNDRVIKLWDVRSPDAVCTYKGHVGNIKTIKLGENKIISGSDDHTIKIWSLNDRDGKCLLKINENNQPISTLTFDDSKIIYGTLNGAIFVNNFES